MDTLKKKEEEKKKRAAVQESNDNDFSTIALAVDIAASIVSGFGSDVTDCGSGGSD